MSVRVFVELQPCAEGRPQFATKHDASRYDYYFRRIRDALRGTLASPVAGQGRSIEVEVELLPPEQQPAVVANVVWLDERSSG